MHDPALVSVIQGAGEAGDEGQGLREGDSPVGFEESAQVLARQVFHDHVGRAGLLAVIKNADNVRVLKFGNHLRFAVEAMAKVRVRGERARKNFDRNRRAERGMDGFINLGHAAASNQFQVLVSAELSLLEHLRQATARGPGRRSLLVINLDAVETLVYEMLQPAAGRLKASAKDGGGGRHRDERPAREVLKELGNYQQADAEDSREQSSERAVDERAVNQEINPPQLMAHNRQAQAHRHDQDSEVGDAQANQTPQHVKESGFGDTWNQNERRKIDGPNQKGDGQAEE